MGLFMMVSGSTPNATAKAHNSHPMAPPTKAPGPPTYATAKAVSSGQTGLNMTASGKKISDMGRGRRPGRMARLILARGVRIDVRGGVF
jgi:hypothetical protein